MNVFLDKLSKAYPEDLIILACDGAAWHRANALILPDNIRLIFLPPATPEMNPIEQIWKEIRKLGFKNEIFKSLDLVVKRLCDTICSLTSDTIQSITARDWIIKCFNQ
jgi:putative transposase